MRSFKPFWGWTKNTSSLPKFYFIFNLFSAPKFFLPSHIPPPYLPLPTSHPPTSPLLPPNWFRVHSIAKTQELLERKQSYALEAWSNALKLGAPKCLKWDPCSTQSRTKLPPICFFSSFCCNIVKKAIAKLPSPSSFWFGYNAAKKSTATTLPLPSFFFVWLERNKDVTFFFFFLFTTHQKKVTTTTPSFFVFWLQCTKKGNGNNVAITFFFCFLVAMHQRRWQQMSSPFLSFF